LEKAQDIPQTSSFSIVASLIVQMNALHNDALRDECEALNAIYGDGTVELTSSTKAVLKLPNSPISFLFTFPADYPDVPPSLQSNSTGSGGRGEGGRAVTILHEVLGRIYQPGQVCLFDLIDETLPQLEDGSIEDSEAAAKRSEQVTTDETPVTDSVPPPPWILTESTVVNKSTFVARALQVSSMTDVANAVSYLMSTNKKVATANHNIKAWRIKKEETFVQDYDDDGETAAGGRLLHLMQLMGVQNVLVVVTRWYGGIKLGPDRFRFINNVAREALMAGRFVREEKIKKGKK
jgi:Uncharacterized protein family UPF0029/RWD domain